MQKELNIEFVDTLRKAVHRSMWKEFWYILPFSGSKFDELNLSIKACGKEGTISIRTSPYISISRAFGSIGSVTTNQAGILEKRIDFSIK